MYFEGGSAMASDQNMMCPKCGAFQKKKEVCEKCGVVVAKFQSIAEETTQTSTKHVEKSPGRELPPIRISVFAIIFVVFIAAAIYGLSKLGGDNEFDKHMQAIPIFNVIKENDPAAYEKLETMLRNSIRNRESNRQIIARVQEFSTSLVKKYVPRASDDAVDVYAQDLLDLIKDAKNNSPTLCYDLLFPEKYSRPEILEYIEKNVNKHFLDTIALVIKTAVQNPQPPPDPKRSQELLNTLVEPITDKFGDDLQLFAKTSHNKIEKKKMCTMSIEIYRRILLLKKKNASMLFRYLIVQG